MEKRLFKILMILMLLGIVCITFYLNMWNTEKPTMIAKNGRMNLLDWDFKKDGIVHLDGQWEIYFNQLLKPQDIKNREVERYFYIPGKLKEQLDGNTTGYMTLHLRVVVPEDVVYGIRIDSMLTSSKVWVNGVEQGGHGKVGKNIKDEKAIYLPVYGYFTPEDGVVDIVIQTSNYRDISPNIRSMDFGLKNQIMDEYMMNISMDNVIIGGLLMIELTYLAIYFLRGKEKSFLYFSILCFLIQLRCCILNERVLVQLYPHMPYELLSKTAAITYYLWIWTYVLFLKEQFKDVSDKIIYFSMVFGSVFTVICLMTENMIYDQLGILTQVLLLCIIIYILIFLIKKSIKGDQKGKLSLVAFFVLIITAMNDIFVNNGVLNNIYIFQIGMFVFAFLESYMLAVNFSMGFNRIKELSIENQEIYEKSIRDSLTNLYNHKYIKQVLSNKIEDYKENKEGFIVLMVDLDHFKSINDKYGHPFGDKVLVRISNLFMKMLRATDTIGRYGGEEFLIILPNTNMVEARKIAERIRKSVENLIWDDSLLKTSISIGLYENEATTKEECIKKVDDLLYRAKKNGRNRVEEYMGNSSRKIKNYA
ncbi:MAG: GGDEF domain-containing protein [Marinisporobacter sp.]|nr:GGDEF domain-containing protein [Marinisporobacter sp.]